MRRRDISTELKNFLSLGDPPSGVEFRVTSQIEDDSFTRKRIEYSGDEGDVIAAFLFLPHQPRNGCGVVAYHQHNGEFHLGKSEVAGLAGNNLQAFGPALAARGVAVLAPDAIGFEDRRAHTTGVEETGDDWLQHYNSMAYRLVNGDILMRKCLDDAQRAMTVLHSVDGIDTNRTGVVGHSYGGSTATYHAAVDERCRFVCASGSLCSFAGRQQEGTGINIFEVVPGIGQLLDAHDLVRSIAPRSQFYLSATSDPYSLDADEVITRSGAEHIEQMRVDGGHALDMQRHDSLIDWVLSRSENPAPDQSE